MIAECERGTLTLEVAPDWEGSSRLTRSDAGGLTSEDLPPWDRHGAILDTFSSLVAGRGGRPDLIDGTRAMELTSAAARSLRRGRAVDLHYEEVSERNNFKTVMTSVGCMVLLGCLVALPAALVGPALGIGQTIYIAYAIPPLLVVFALLQVLRLAMKPERPVAKGPAGDRRVRRSVRFSTVRRGYVTKGTRGRRRPRPGRGGPTRRRARGRGLGAEDWIVQLGYLGFFLVLVLGGLGLPVPEEVPVILAAVLSRKGTLWWPFAFGSCLLGVLAGDFVVYFLGYFYGEKVLSLPLTRKFLTKPREAQIKGYFHRHGIKILIVGRFAVGFRTAAYLTAGILKLPALRLFVTDLFAATFSTTLMFGIGYLFAHQIEQATDQIHRWQRWIVLGLTIGLAIWIAVRLVRFYRTVRRTPVIGQRTTSPLPPTCWSTTQPPPPPDDLPRSPPGALTRPRPFAAVGARLWPLTPAAESPPGRDPIRR